MSEQARTYKDITSLDTIIEDIQTMVLTIGFPRSGSSLLGYLLTAHPNVVMADEPPNVKALYQVDLPEMVDRILKLDYQRKKNAQKRHITKPTILRGNRQNRYTPVPNQYQGHFKQIKVIGVKRSMRNTQALLQDHILKNLRKALGERGISLKFIFTVRNPYDMFDGVLAPTGNKGIKSFLKRSLFLRILFQLHPCELNKRLLKQIDPKDIFISRHEDMVKAPRQSLTKLCNFLQIPILGTYLDDCASRVVKEPHRSRFELDWTKDQKREVESLIEKYDFLSGYSWES